jgi:hypothetical protein
MKGMDRACHRRVHLASQLAQRAAVELLIGDHHRERRVPGRRMDRQARRQPLLHAWNERAAEAGRAVEVATDDLTVAVDDRTHGVDDREDADLRRPQRAVGAALAGRLALLVLERLPDGGRPAGTARPEREDAQLGRPERRSPERLVGVNGVIARAVVEDDRSRDEGDLHPAGRMTALREELGRDAGRRLEPIQRAAREADRVYPLVAAERPR